MSDRIIQATRVVALPSIGMLSLRADMSDPAIGAAIAACGLTLPERRQIRSSDTGRMAWMSPDEALILCDTAATPALIATLSAALDETHHLLAEVSDARARFAIEGRGARVILAKLCPVDLAPGQMEPGQIRRTRLAQIAAAIWMTGPERFELVCFSSVADYAARALAGAASYPDDLRLP